MGEYTAVLVGLEWGRGVEPYGVRRITEVLSQIGVVTVISPRHLLVVVISAQDPRLE